MFVFALVLSIIGSELLHNSMSDGIATSISFLWFYMAYVIYAARFPNLIPCPTNTKIALQPVFDEHEPSDEISSL